MVKWSLLNPLSFQTVADLLVINKVTAEKSGPESLYPEALKFFFSQSIDKSKIKSKTIKKKGGDIINTN